MVSKPGTVNEDLEVATAFSSSQTIENCLDCAVTTTVNNKKVKKAIKEAEKNMSKIGRILVRNSGTEPIIRVMGESHNYQILKKNIGNIATVIKKYS